MKRNGIVYYVVLLVLCLLVSCSSDKEIQELPKQDEPVPIIEPDIQTPPVKSSVQEPIMKTVTQTGPEGTARFGLSDDGRVLKIEKTGSVWDFKYDSGNLVEMRGPELIEFMYSKGHLDAIDTGSQKYQFRYDSRGRIVEVKGGQETLYFDYDSLDLIRAVRRGVAGKTSIDYDNSGRIKYLTRGKFTTDVIFDDRGRVRNFDADDTKMILGYWRDDKLISLTGKTFGRGLAVSYGPDYPPREAKIVHESDATIFSAAYTDALYRVVDEYVYCKYARTLKSVLFEGISYTIFVNYFKGGMVDYLKMQFICSGYES